MPKILSYHPRTSLPWDRKTKGNNSMDTTGLQESVGLLFRTKYLARSQAMMKAQRAFHMNFFKQEIFWLFVEYVGDFVPSNGT